MPRTFIVAVAALSLLAASGANAQGAAATAPPRNTVKIGELAPDFALPGATRYGTLRDHVRLSDFRGQTVVLAFFFKARTKG